MRSKRWRVLQEAPGGVGAAAGKERKLAAAADLLAVCKKAAVWAVLLDTVSAFIYVKVCLHGPLSSPSLIHRHFSGQSSRLHTI
jgi:hypothetical protein